MTAKQALRARIDEMTEEEAEELLDFLNLQDEPGTLSEDELARVLAAEAEIEAGQYVTLEEVKAKYGLRPMRFACRTLRSATSSALASRPGHASPPG
ncbi:MAG: hypothetical protein HS107_14580 [Thermoflexaceae bacterium]|nr:hypothetical protein [Thermoflexaceae bacterium]